MHKYLLPLLIGCTEVPEECQPQLDRTEQACDNASVVGTNSNPELHSTIDDLRECLSYDVRIVCNDDGWQKILTVSRR